MKQLFPQFRYPADKDLVQLASQRFEQLDEDERRAEIERPAGVRALELAKLIGSAKQAFALVELLVIIAVIAIVAAIATPNIIEIKNATSSPTYEAWKRAYPAYAHMSYADWKILKAQTLLPVTVQENK